MDRVLAAAVAILILVAGSGCSVLLAGAAHDPSPQLSVLLTSRATVEEQLGPPVQTRTLKSGHLLCQYEYEYKNSEGAAWLLHFPLDVMTLGLWELVGTPMELFREPTRVSLWVRYDTAGIGVEMSRSILPPCGPRADGGADP